MNKVLFVSYVYPPDGASSGMLRPLKFCSYLREHNWSVTVLTARETDYLIKDETQLENIPDHVNVYRAFAPNSRKYFYIKGKSLSLLSFPDRVLWWWPFAYRKGMEAIRIEQSKMIWSTSPMPTTNLIAYSLKKKTGLPWIADFRDPWVHVSDTGWRRKINEFLERKVMHFADAVVVTTDWMKREILDRIPDLVPEKVSVIYNGYDEEDFTDLTPKIQVTDAPFVLTYTGLLDSTYRNPEPFFQALRQLRAGSLLPSRGFRVDFYGCSEYLTQPVCRNLIASLGLSDIVFDCGRVSRKQSLQVLVDADALLLIQDADMTRSAIPAKAFDYLRAGKPILSLSSEGATADLMERFPCVTLVREPRNIASVARGLEKLFTWPKENKSLNMKNEIEQFSRKNLTKQLARLMDSLVNK